MFEVRNGELHYKSVDKPLTYNKGRLRSVGEIADKILGKNKLHDFGFDIPRGKATARQVMLNKVEEELLLRLT